MLLEVRQKILDYAELTDRFDTRFLIASRTPSSSLERPSQNLLVERDSMENCVSEEGPGSRNREWGPNEADQTQNRMISSWLPNAHPYLCMIGNLACPLTKVYS